MQIGQIIRKYRKDRNMTQEEMANRLGVTAPAVNKWENGASFPDITLLAPIARLLGISTDELLSFHEELTNEEIGSMVRELDTILKEKSFEEAFWWAKEKLELYPNSGQLCWQLALILDARRLTGEVEDTGRYDETIEQWYRRALDSEDEEIRTRAADSLFGFYMRKEEYEKAEECLVYLSVQNPEKKRKQAFVYSKTGRRDEAYKAYEELLFSNYQMASMLFGSIYMLVMEDGNIEKAHMLAEKQEELARAYDMGEYYEICGSFELVSVEEDADAAIHMMERMLRAADSICSYVESPLYEHMKFKEIDGEFKARFKQNLLKYFREAEVFGFLKDDLRWKELTGKESARK